MRVLQLYITRELLKNFALAIVGLTLTFSFAGGVLNMVKSEMVTAAQLLRFFHFVLPFSLTLTLPVAGMFSCAIVYGRLAADNEFDACKASGINLHRLFAPVLAMGIVITICTFLLSNFLLPHATRQLEMVAQRDAQTVLAAALRSHGALEYGRYVIHAADADLVEREDGSEAMTLKEATFMEIDRESLVRIGTVEHVHIDFWIDEESDEPKVAALMRDVRALDLTRPQRPRFYQEQERPISPQTLNRPFREKVKFMALPSLWRYYRDITEMPAMSAAIEELRRKFRHHLFHRMAREQLETGEGVLLLEDDRQAYEIRAGRAWLDEATGRLQVSDVNVVQRWRDENGRDRVRRYRAGEGTFSVDRSYALDQDVVTIELRDGVNFTDSLDETQVVQATKRELEDVALPPRVLEGERALSDAELVGHEKVLGRKIRSKEQLLRALPDFDLGQGFQMDQAGLILRMLSLRLQIHGIMHSRLAFSASVLGMVLLAASLGIVFRGGQFLTAFAISFVPGLVVMVMNISGRRMTEDAARHMMGIGVIWCGPALLVVADLIVLLRSLRR